MDTKTDNRQSQMEKAEASTENVNLGTPDPGLSAGDAGAPMERGAGQISRPDKPIQPAERDKAGGITNRALSEDEENQRSLPERGHEQGE